jgi:hypothetical protein
VALPCHRSTHPKWSSDQHKGWITSRGSEHPDVGAQPACAGKLLFGLLVSVGSYSAAAN